LGDDQVQAITLRTARMKLRCVFPLPLLDTRGTILKELIR